MEAHAGYPKAQAVSALQIIGLVVGVPFGLWLFGWCCSSDEDEGYR